MHDKTNSTHWLRYLSKDTFIERFEAQSTAAGLLASKNGTEIIHHSLTKGAGWVLRPQEGWNELESVFVLTGELSYQSSNIKGTLRPGDFLSGEPIEENVLFRALEDVSFLYICSNYVFHEYSQVTRTFLKLAVDIEEKDGYTASHCNRIRDISYEIGERLKLSSDQLIALRYGSFFHDIGKVHIPNKILGKPGRLTAEEFDIMKMHTVIGKSVLASTGLPHLIGASIVAEQHHERFDGSGYPYGLKGQEIDICASIVAVVDSYDAMTTNRPYQSAKSHETAVNEILELRGKLYHPDVVDTFLCVQNDFDTSLERKG